VRATVRERWRAGAEQLKEHGNAESADGDATGENGETT